MLHHHGDLDWPGVDIANRLVARCGVLPGRMTAADYEAAGRPGDGLPLTGRPAEPSWDADLGAAMRRLGMAVHEEQVVADLLTGWPP